MWTEDSDLWRNFFIKILEASNESLPVQLYLRSGIKRADIARLVALSVYGGVPALAIVRVWVRYSWNLTSRLVSFNNSCSLKGFKRYCSSFLCFIPCLLPNLLTLKPSKAMEVGQGFVWIRDCMLWICEWYLSLAPSKLLGLHSLLDSSIVLPFD